MKKVSIVIPTYNEEKRIARTIKKYLSYFKTLKKNKILDFEMIIVLNACKDNTLNIVKKYSCKELIILNFEQGGKGFAIIQGFKDSLKRKNDLIGFVDADMATPPKAFYDLIKNIEEYDGVIANRWDKKSIIKTPQTILRKIMSRGYNVILRALFLFSYRDTQCGAKLFKKKLIKKILPKLGSSEWNFDVDLLFYARIEKAKIKSIPTIWNDQKESKINLKKTPITMLLSAIRLRLIHSPFKFIVIFYRKLPDNFKFHKK